MRATTGGDGFVEPGPPLGWDCDSGLSTNPPHALQPAYTPRITLPPGSRIGPYDILSTLGAGGMGEVYRAHDAKLHRDVAIKVLLPAVANDPDRRARFSREAQVLASLNHPNIAAIYGLEESEGVLALVMELVDGPTLADRIAQGAIPLADALPIAQQIAEALEAAHEQGIIHRDLKPANIKVRPDGVVKVLDFGLAKAMDPAGASSDHAMNSPTISLHATQAGMILGTAAYMSPEQARGKAVDKRSDLWAFGCVLYEMLTGTRAFAGDDVSDTLARVLMKEPDWEALPASTPLAIRKLLHRCLAKDRRQRLSDAADARLEIEDAQTAPLGEAVVPLPARHVPTWRRVVPYIVACGLLTLVVGTTVWFATRPPLPRVTRFTITPPASAPLTLDVGRHLAIAPDGTRLAYVGANGTLLVVHALDQLAPTVLTGLGAPSHPVFSPNGQWIAFFDGVTALKKVATTGGPAVTLSPINGPPNGGANWAADDTIIFMKGDNSTGLLRVRAAGGEPEVLTRPDRAHGEAYHYYPEVLPGGKAVLFTILPSGPGQNQVAVLDLRTGERTVLVRGGSQAQYVAPGYLVYALGGTLWAVAFDLGRLAVLGSPVPVVEGVMPLAGGLGAVFSVTPDGTLVYVPGGAQTGAQRTLVWVDRRGREEPLEAPPRAYVYPRLSPDGKRVAVSVTDQEGDIWIWDLSRQTPLKRFTFDPGMDLSPVWTPDGRRLVWSSQRVLPRNLYGQAADGSGAAERLTESPYGQFPYGFSPDGTRLLLREDGPGTGQDLAMLDSERPSAGSGRGEPVEPRRVTPLIRTAFNERNGEISPDGRWLAYESNESGQDEIYVRPFPAVDAGRWQLSTGGGRQPLWARNVRELFYRTSDGALVAVPIASAEEARGPGFSAGTPSLLVKGQYYNSSGAFLGRTYDVSLDGQRFLMIKEGGVADQTATPTQIVVVQNWVEELKRLVPTRR